MYTGTPGSGKSLHVARNIYKNLRKGITVITNFSFRTDLIPKRTGVLVTVPDDKLTPQFLRQYAVEHAPRTKGHIKESQILLVIDECQIMFNPREWGRGDRSEWVRFFTQHRKYGYDVVLITQFDRLLDRQIRSCAEYECLHRNVRNYKTFGFILSLLFGGHLFVSITTWYGMRAKCNATWFFYRNKYGRLYDSYKIFDEVVETAAGGAPRGGRGAGAPPRVAPPPPSAQGQELAAVESALVSGAKICGSEAARIEGHNASHASIVCPVTNDTPGAGEGLKSFRLFRRRKGSTEEQTATVEQEAEEHGRARADLEKLKGMDLEELRRELGPLSN